jgi:hypothetical protein
MSPTSTSANDAAAPTIATRLAVRPRASLEHVRRGQPARAPLLLDAIGCAMAARGEAFATASRRA